MSGIDPTPMGEKQVNFVEIKENGQSDGSNKSSQEYKSKLHRKAIDKLRWIAKLRLKPVLPYKVSDLK